MPHINYCENCGHCKDCTPHEGLTYILPGADYFHKKYQETGCHECAVCYNRDRL